MDIKELTMSAPSGVANVRSLADARTSDRRSDRRYPITLPLQYKLIRKGQSQSLGFGRTLNISTHGVLFEVDHVVPASGRIELALNWPFTLQGSCCLRLVMRGSILRTDEKTIALKAEFHQFRTAGRSLCERIGVIH
jgi:hypothetical protein